jgi:hypothetical protein
LQDVCDALELAGQLAEEHQQARRAWGGLPQRNLSKPGQDSEPKGSPRILPLPAGQPGRVE